MSRSIVGAAVGAGGATAYYNKDSFGDYVRAAITPGWLSQAGRSSGGASKGPELDELSRMVQQLSLDVQRRNNGAVTIVHGSERGSGTALYIAVAVTGGVVYLRLVKGWKFGDMLYVTRSGLKKSIAQVTEGVDGLGQRLADVKAFLQQRIRALAVKQDETIAAQQRMGEHLDVVGRDVEHTRDEVSEMHGAVRELEAGLEEISLSQQYANRGIYILCKVVGEMMKGAAPTHAGFELENYIKHPPTISGRAVPGLEGLLQESPADHQRGRLPPPNVIQRSASITGGSCPRPRLGAIDDAARSSSLRWRGSDVGSEFDFAVSARG